MRAAWLEINLSAYQENLHSLSEYVDRPVLAVVKANGYGHGLQTIARAAVAAGCPGVAVALPEEGAELRAGGQLGRIVVLGLSLEQHAQLILEHDLEQTVTREPMLQALSAAAARVGKAARVHVKVDTGMSRVGISPDEAVGFCRRVAADPQLLLAGVATHFASAEDELLAGVEDQWRHFAALAAEFANWNPRPTLHAANSAAALWFPPARLDWVRGGLLTYGVPPAPRGLPFPVRPVASLHARIVQVREVPAGAAVSYGGTWTAPRPTRLALIPLGYGDGYPWSLSNRGEALIHGRRAPIRGRVCMDQFLVDVTDLPPVAVGEQAVLIGKQGSQEITVGELAERAGTISYEILTRLAERLPRLVVASS